jgi:tetratricopeptide (TPR) repeat protein
MPNFSYATIFQKKIIYIWLILIVLVFATSIYKIAKVKNNSHFNPSSPGSLYYAESAFHYRYAEIIAKSGKNLFSLLKNDKFVQYPETINIFKYETVMMEFFCGFLYRIFNFGLPFNLFLIYFNCFFSSLALIMVFLITKKLFKSNLISLGAALYYVTTPASYLRTAAGSYLREDFVLVFLLLSVWLILIQLSTESKPLLSIVSGLVIIFNLSSWHFSEFIYVCMVPFFFWMFTQRPIILKKFFYTFLLIFLAGLVIPVLKTRVFATSILMCSLYAICIAYFLKKFIKKPLNKLLVALFIFIVLLGIRNALGIYESSYSHVFDMFLEKLKFFLKKPDNPLLLSFSARQLWEEAFNTPTPSEIWWFGKLAFPLGIIGSLCLLWSERKQLNSGGFIASLSIILFLLSIMAKRILVVAAPFLSVALWGCTIYDRKKNYLKMAFSFLLILNALDLNLRPIELGRFTEASYRELFEWINSNTQPQDAFVGHIHLSPMILLNTGRPEVLHPKFENSGIRKKYEELIMSIYSEDESDLYEFCKKNKAKYFIYDWGFFITDGKDSIRYLGGAVPDISEKTVASRLHFSSPELKHFRPLFRNSAFIVYEIMEGRNSDTHKLPYSPIYDLSLYTKEKGFYKDTRQTYDQVIIPYAEKVNQSSRLLNDKVPFMAVEILKPVVKKIPRGSEAVFVLGQALFQLEKYEEAEQLLKEYLNSMSLEELAIEPLGAKMLELLADVQYFRGQYDEAFATLNKCLKLPLHSAEVYKKLGILKEREKNQEEAEKYFKKYEKYMREGKT